MIVRNDLNYPQKCVQSCHAAMESAREFLKPGQEHPHLVVGIAKDEKKIKKLMKQLQEENICFKIFRESDMENQITALATEPLLGDRRNSLRKYQLLKL